METSLRQLTETAAARLASSMYWELSMTQDGKDISDQTMEDSFGKKDLEYVDQDMASMIELSVLSICWVYGTS